MTRTEEITVLTKLFRKVKKNGYTTDIGVSSLDQLIEHKIYYKFIFDHAFQKALWGDLWINVDTKKPLVFDPAKGKIHINMVQYRVAWQLYAQEMSIADDYLAYLATVI